MNNCPALPFLLLFISLSASELPKPLHLENKDGRIIEATVLSVSADSVHVRRADGKEFDIVLSTLKPASVEAVRAAVPAAATPSESPGEGGPSTTSTAERPLPKREPVTPDDIPEKVVVRTGQTIMATFTEAGDGLTKPVPVKDEPADTPVFKVEFERRKPGEKITFAMVSSTFDRTVAVKCLARNKGSKKWYRTSIIPLRKGIPCGESWGDDVEELVFYDFAWSQE